MIKLPSSLLTKIAVGVGVSLVAPVVYRVLQSGEPITARSLMKEGIKTYNQVRIALVEAKENLSDLAAEAQAEAEAASEQTFESAQPLETEQTVEQAAVKAVVEEQSEDTSTENDSPKGKH